MSRPQVVAPQKQDKLEAAAEPWDVVPAVEAPAEGSGQAPTIGVGPTPPTPPRRKIDILREAEAALEAARDDGRRSSDALKLARTSLAKALSASAGTAPSGEAAEQANIRAHLAAEAQLRADRKAGLAPPRRGLQPGPSRVDQIAAATAGATYGKRNAYAYKRGAVSLAEAIRQNNLRAAAERIGATAAAAKSKP